MDKKLNIIFMGTPDFAVASLDAILQNSEHTIVGVITAEDKKAGRGKKIQRSAVKDYAVEHDLLILQPSNLKDPDFVEQVKELKADIMVVVAFRMLPQVIWDMPVYGTFNLHASLLPQYRGAAPINHAVMNGESKSGITTFFLDKEIDTGKIILQEEVQISPEDSAGDLHDKLMERGAQLVTQTLDIIAEGNVASKEQTEYIEDVQVLRSAPKIFKQHCQLDWNDTTENVHNKIRGLSPYPTAYTLLCDDKGNEYYIKVFKTRKIKMNDCKPGRVINDTNKSFAIQTKDGALEILDLQLRGKKRMATTDFLRGFEINNEMFTKSPLSLA